MKPSFLVTLYYTLASIIGLILSVIGAAMFINLMLTTYVLQIPRYPSMPPSPYIDSAVKEVGLIEERRGNTLSDEDKESLESWKTSYAQWKIEQETFDRANVEKKNQLATSISMLVVGIPVLLFHQKELRKKKE